MSVGAGDIITAADMNRALSGSPEKPMCILRRSTNLTVATAVQTAVPWDVEDLDTHGWHSTSVNTSRITPTVAGWIRFSGQITYGAAAGGPGRRALQFRRNGTTAHWGELIPGLAAANLAPFASRDISMNGTTDYIELVAFQDSGSSITTADLTNTFLTAEFVRDL
jgi:hypothetical protein